MRKEQVVLGMKVTFKDDEIYNYSSSSRIEHAIEKLDSGESVYTVSVDVFEAYIKNKSSYSKSYKNCVKLADHEGNEYKYDGDVRIPIRYLMTVEERREELESALEYKRQQEAEKAAREAQNLSFARTVGQLAEAYGLEISTFDIQGGVVKLDEKNVEKLLEFARTYVYPNSNKFK